MYGKSTRYFHQGSPLLAPCKPSNNASHCTWLPHSGLLVDWPAPVSEDLDLASNLTPPTISFHLLKLLIQMVPDDEVRPAIPPNALLQHVLVVQLEPAQHSAAQLSTQARRNEATVRWCATASTQAATRKAIPSLGSSQHVLCCSYMCAEVVIHWGMNVVADTVHVRYRPCRCIQTRLSNDNKNVVQCWDIFKAETRSCRFHATDLAH